jgi:hypothetical protein
MKKATIALFAVVIALLIAILAIVAMDYWNFPTPAPTPTPKPTATPTPTPTASPHPTPTPTPTPTNYAELPGTLTITSADYLIWSGYPQLWVYFNWTGESFSPPKFRLSLGEHIFWNNFSTYVFNYTGNRDPIIWVYFPLYDYAPTATLELAFFDVNAATPFKVAYFPVANVGLVPIYNGVPGATPTPNPSSTPAPTPTPQPTPTPTPIQVDPSGQIIITSVTTFTPTTHAPIAITFTWTGAQIYVPRIRVTVDTDTYWHSAMTVNSGENGLSVWPDWPPLSYPSGMQVELAFFDATGDTPFRTAHYTV